MSGDCFSAFLSIVPFVERVGGGFTTSFLGVGVTWGDAFCTFLDHTGMFLVLLEELLLLPFGRFTLGDKPFLDCSMIARS